MTRLCKEAKELDIPLEINLLGLSERRAYPRKSFFSIAAEVGNPVILGCDAHHVDAVCRQSDIELGEKFAEELGLVLLDTVEFKSPKSVK